MGGGGVQKKFGEENRHFETWRGEKIDDFLARIYTPESKIRLCVPVRKSNFRLKLDSI
jgi:hypothetical protein